MKMENVQVDPRLIELSKQRDGQAAVIHGQTAEGEEVLVVVVTGAAIASFKMLAAVGRLQLEGIDDPN